MILGTLEPVPNDEGIHFDGDMENEVDGDIEAVGDKKPIGWVYVGSHNFTSSAWGTFTTNSTAAVPVFHVRDMISVSLVLMLDS
jgi:Tyrosyl-DNA phosphodiesterase